MTKKPPIDPAKVTVRTLRAMKAVGDKIVALTTYDAPMARLVNAAGVDVVLVGVAVLVDVRITSTPAAGAAVQHERDVVALWREVSG